MDRLSQHGKFDSSTEQFVREALLNEFSENSDWSVEDFGEVMDAFDFGACQRSDGTIYGTAGQCRKGTPISIRPGENALALRKKALDRGLKHKDVNEIFGDLRNKYGQKQIKGDTMVQSLGGRINRRLGVDDAKPPSRPRPEPIGKTDAVNDLMARARARALAKEEARRLDIDEQKPINRPISQPQSLIKPLTARNTVDPKLKDSGIGIVVGKGLLKRPDADLQYVLQSRSINDAQRKKIEDELRRRNVTPNKGPDNFENWRRLRDKQEKATAKRLERAALSGGVPGYNAVKEELKGGKVLGEGAQGRVVETNGPPPGVVKKGKVGQNEVAALKLLEDKDFTPKFLGGAITGRPRVVSFGLGGHVTERSGIIGMTKVAGVPFNLRSPTADAAQKDAATDEYIRIRKEIHTRGVAHNDMHRGNFFYDEKTGRGGLVDFGLAQISPRAALIEALGFGDFQAQRMLSSDSNNLSNRVLSRNQRDVISELENKGVGIRDARIRSSNSTLERIFGDKISEKEAERYIQMVYKGL